MSPGSGHTQAHGRDRPWTVQAVCRECGEPMLAPVSGRCYGCATGRPRTLQPREVVGRIARLTQDGVAEKKRSAADQSRQSAAS